VVKPSQHRIWFDLGQTKLNQVRIGFGLAPLELGLTTAKPSKTWGSVLPSQIEPN